MRHEYAGHPVGDRWPKLPVKAVVVARAEGRLAVGNATKSVSTEMGKDLR